MQCQLQKERERERKKKKEKQRWRLEDGINALEFKIEAVKITSSVKIAIENCNSINTINIIDKVMLGKNLFICGSYISHEKRKKGNILFHIFFSSKNNIVCVCELFYKEHLVMYLH